MFKPRPHQQAILEYRSGKMGVSAVPGSGKTHTLSYLAALLILEEYIEENQEVLIVTLVNSAVDNFSSRIAGFVQEFGLLPGTNYRVRTLHGLAHDIIRERPELVGLSSQFEIIDERESYRIIENATVNWLRANPDFVLKFTKPDNDPFRDTKTREKWKELAINLTTSFIRLCKDYQTTPEELREKLGSLHSIPPFLQMGTDVYDDYQRALRFRGALDFDDLIRLALDALQADANYLQRLRYRWPYILEDEAQDSSRLQELILRTLVGESGNWVRVGDPNQAIYETFTTASPAFLRNFLRENGVQVQSLPSSGRSTFSIIKLANYLIQWNNELPTHEELRGVLSPPYIEPAPPNDPQPNPPDQPESIYLVTKKYDSTKELQAVIQSLRKWLPHNQDKTVAVLVPRNERGAKVVEALRQSGIEVVELLQTTQSTRTVAEMLCNVLRVLSDPLSSRLLVELYQTLRSQQAKQLDFTEIYHQVLFLLRRCERVEDYLAPTPERNWLEELENQGTQNDILRELYWFQQSVRRWQAAGLLPIDQLLLTIAQDLFTAHNDLALAHKLALLLGHTRLYNPDWQLSDFTAELDSIVKRQRKFIGFSEDDTGFDPDQHKGKVVVATIHKAKGLEWDRVYLMSANNYDFPSAQPYDKYFAEKYFIRDELNLEAETLFRLRALLEGDLPGVYIEDGIATQKARFDYSAERLRLFYVGITRARRELVVTWNTGKNNSNQPALPLVVLKSFWEQQNDRSI